MVRLESGVKLVNNSTHGKCKTDSIGFCFLPEEVKFIDSF